LLLSEKTEAEQLNTLRNKALETLDQKIKAAEASLSKPNLHAKAKEQITSKMVKLGKVQEDIRSEETHLNLVQRLISDKELKDSKEIRDDIAVALFVAAFSENPGQKEALLGAVQAGLTTASLKKAVEFKADLIKEHVLVQLKDKAMQKSLLQVINIASLEEKVAEAPVATDEETKIRGYATKGLLGELAGSIGDACYSKSDNGIIMARTNPSQITSVIFEAGE
jgi:hypothetical protein